MSAKMTVSTDFRRVLAAFKMMGKETRERVEAQVRTSTARVAQGARMRAPVSGPGSRKAKGRLGPGELRDTIREEFSEDGLTGFVKAGYGKLNRARRTKAASNQRVLTRDQTLRRDHAAAIRMDNALSRDAGVYAMVTEYGSPGRGQPAQPFLRPSKEAELPALRRGVGDALRGAVEASKQGSGVAA